MLKTKSGRRRFLQFSLRTVLVLMTVLAVLFGTWLDRGRREKEAVEALGQKSYVGIYYDYQADRNGNWVPNPSPPGPDWARAFLGEHCFRRVVRLSASGSTLDDDALAQVAHFRQLRVLYNDVSIVSVVEVRLSWPSPGNYVGSASITDAGFAHLGGLHCLETLILVGTNVTDDGLRSLSRLGRLKRLKISSPLITDRGIVHFLRHKNLEDLCVSGTSISEAGVAELRRGLPNCRIFGPKDEPTDVWPGVTIQEEEEERLGIFSR